MWSLGYTALALLPSLALGKIYTSPNLISLLQTGVETTSVAGGIDGPKLTPLAATLTSYEWYYFDVVSASTNASVTAVFINSGAAGFDVLNLAGPMSIMLTGSYADGTSFGNWVIPALGGMNISSDSDSIYGEWKGAGGTFVGTGLSTNSSQFVATLNLPSQGITGTITMTARAPGRYPCGPNVPGQTELVAPTVYWSNLIPDAQASVNMTFNNQPIMISDGIGYHDKNWGTAPFATALKWTYWGHAYFGTYAVVWSNNVDSAGNEHVSGYVVQNGQVLGNSCASGFVKVRPWGQNSQFPPTPLTGVAQGLTMTFQLDQGPFVVNITSTGVTLDLAVYRRQLGNAVGGFVGGPQFTGRSQYEQFALALV